MRERRTYRRTRARRELELLPLSAPVRRLPWESPGPEREARVPEKNFGRLIDIGCGGVGAIFNEPVAVGIACEVRIHGTGGKVQAERGRVCTLERGAQGNRVGIAFDHPIFTLGDTQRRGPMLAGDYEIRPPAIIVDDEPDVRNALDRFLTRRGLRVFPVANADQALAAIRLEPPLLMLLDLKMPKVTGLELLERMQYQDLHVPNIWAMSGYASNDDASLALELGASKFLDKPFDLEHLDDSLRALAPAA